MIDGKRSQLISLLALIVLIIHIFHPGLFDTLSLFFFIIAIIPWIIPFKPEWKKSKNIAAISVIALIFIFFHIINPQLSIDNISISLFLFSMILWIVPHVPYVVNLDKKPLVQIGISLLAFLILIVHVSRPGLTIDIVTVSLLVISIFPWANQFLTSAEVAGIGKLEFKDELVEEITQKAEDAGLLRENINPKEAKDAVNIPSSKTTDSLITEVNTLSKDESKSEYSFQQFAETDPNLALAGLRIEIEEKLKYIAKYSDLKLRDSLSVDVILEFLYNKDILSREEKSVISELINLLNKAVHGAKIDRSAAHKAISMGQGILNALDNKLIDSLFSDMEFVRIPSGDFMMGSQKDEIGRSNDEEPAHRVTIKNSFDIGKYPVTQKQWIALMGYNPSKFKGEERPVENVSWKDVDEFIKKLNETVGTKRYRLPSEAEWEYACRAGSKTKYFFGDDESKLDEYAWYGASSHDGETHPVGLKKANMWGLFDMYGNVGEWVQDKWHDSYENNPPTDGKAWEEGNSSVRVIRGGSWSTFRTSDCKSASRTGRAEEDRRVNFGFRIVRNL